jgi:hypothetical protein
MESNGLQKDKNPMTEFQAPNKFQFFNIRFWGLEWNFEIGYYLVIGAWLLLIWDPLNGAVYALRAVRIA